MITAMIAAFTLQTTNPAASAQSDVKPLAVKAATSKATTQEDPNKRVCRRMTPTGSYIDRNVCKPQAEWDSEAAGAAAFVAEIQMNYGKNLNAEHSPLGLGGFHP